MRIINKIFKTNNKFDFKLLINNLTKLRDESEILNITPNPTGYSWLGVHNAGLSLFPDNTLGMPHYYSNTLLSETQITDFVNTIISLKFKQVIFNGFPSYFSLLINKLNSFNTNLVIGVIYHGFLSELAQNEVQQKSWQLLINLAKEKKIDKLGFVKKNMPEYFEKTFGIKSFLLYNKTKILNDLPIQKTGINIGVLVNHSFRKNIYNQVAAALMIKDAKVYVNSKKGLECLGNAERIIEVGHLDHKSFIKLLSQMQLNMHVTFSESAGGQVLPESLACGVPCLSSLTHGYMDFDKELKKVLIVDRFEDPYAIYLKAKKVLDNYEKIRLLGLEYSEMMNKKVEEKLTFFLNA